MPPENQTKVREIMQGYALADSGDEIGAKEHRFKATSIDPAKGSAAGYIAKYIAKNIDGYKLEQDLYGNDAIEAAERITAWANASGIRQFQQICGPSVAVWRQLRKLDKTDDTELESIRQMATASDWAAFMLAMGGYEIPRKDRPIKPFYDYRRQLRTDGAFIRSHSPIQKERAMARKNSLVQSTQWQIFINIKAVNSWITGKGV